MKTIKNCPCCRGACSLISGMGEHWILCSGCEATSGMFSTEEAAINSWGRRPDEAVLMTRLGAVPAMVVESLFTNGFGNNATRLVLEGEDGSDLGGWSKAAAFQQIKKAIAIERSGA